MRIASYAAAFGLLLPMACPAAASDLSAEVGLVSDYRYRGLSLSDGGPAVQVQIAFEEEEGAHAELWASTIKEHGSSSKLELQLSGGYTLALGDRFSLDASAAFYAYPEESDANYAEASVTGEYSHGPAALSIGAAFVPRQNGTRDETGRAHRNNYVFAGIDFKLDRLPVTLSASLGHERGYFDEVDHGGKWDWRAGAEYELAPLRIGLAYSASNAASDALVATIAVDL
jgi:uncharacterized protein (TIGR02001 family)